MSSANEEEEEEKEDGCANAAVVVVCNDNAENDNTPAGTVSSKRVNKANTLADFDGCEDRTDFTILTYVRYYFKYFAFSGNED
jgi:hypothetical protein